MDLVDIKSRAKTPITVTLSEKEFGATPALAGTLLTRTMEQRDKVSGEIRAKNVVVRCPPAIRFPAGGTIEGLPESVLTHPAIKSLLMRHTGRRPKLVLVKTYKADPPEKSKKKKAAKKRASRS